MKKNDTYRVFGVNQSNNATLLYAVIHLIEVVDNIAKEQEFFKDKRLSIAESICECFGIDFDKCFIKETKKETEQPSGIFQNTGEMVFVAKRAQKKDDDTV